MASPTSSQAPKFVDPNRSEFFATVRERVNDYFDSQGLSRHANGLMWTKAVLLMSGFVGLYSLILFGGLGVWPLLGLTIVLGMFVAFIGFNVGHDAIHGAFTSSARLNYWLGQSFTLLGANPYMWNIVHNRVHHTYTNIPGHDDDIEVAPALLRLSGQGPVRPQHRFQHIYAFFLYSLTSLVWVFRKDYVKFFKFRTGPLAPVGGHPRIEWFNLFFFKALNYGLFFFLPLALLPLAWWQVLLGFVLMHMAAGLTLSLVFQMAHVVESTQFPLPNESMVIEESWAVHQMRTTANFARHSPLANLLTGGLNQQVEHHLFPKICHVHYPAIGNIVQQTAREFGVPYLEYPTFGAAMRSHYRTLRRFGREAVVEEAEPVSMLAQA